MGRQIVRLARCLSVIVLCAAAQNPLIAAGIDCGAQFQLPNLEAVDFVARFLVMVVVVFFLAWCAWLCVQMTGFCVPRPLQVTRHIPWPMT